MILPSQGDGMDRCLSQFRTLAQKLVKIVLAIAPTYEVAPARCGHELQHFHELCYEFNQHWAWRGARPLKSEFLFCFVMEKWRCYWSEVFAGVITETAERFGMRGSDQSRGSDEIKETVDRFGIPPEDIRITSSSVFTAAAWFTGIDWRTAFS